ncbi:hypothetical protein CFOL_v3_20164, partial [Cephalotus follicularis]
KLKKTPPLWTDKHTQLIRQIKNYAKEIPCLHLVSPLAFKVVETDASDIGYMELGTKLKEIMLLLKRKFLQLCYVFKHFKVI